MLIGTQKVILPFDKHFVLDIGNPNDVIVKCEVAVVLFNGQKLPLEQLILVDRVHQVGKHRFVVSQERVVQ